MFRLHFATFAAACSLAAAALPAAAQGQPAQPSASSPVNVTGQRLTDAAVRKDVSKVCPAVHAELSEALASAQRQVASGGIVRLRFTLESGQVVDARASDGPRAYHRFVRSAIHSVNCASDRAGRQVFELAVRFAEPNEVGANKVALLTE